VSNDWALAKGQMAGAGMVVVGALVGALVVL